MVVVVDRDALADHAVLPDRDPGPCDYRTVLVDEAVGTDGDPAAIMGFQVDAPLDVDPPAQADARRTIRQDDAAGFQGGGPSLAGHAPAAGDRQGDQPIHKIDIFRLDVQHRTHSI